MTRRLLNFVCVLSFANLQTVFTFMKCYSLKVTFFYVDCRTVTVTSAWLPLQKDVFFEYYQVMRNHMKKKFRERESALMLLTPLVLPSYYSKQSGRRSSSTPSWSLFSMKVVVASVKLARLSIYSFR